MPEKSNHRQHNASVSSGGNRSLSDLPGPKSLPLVGNLLQLDVNKLHKVLEHWADLYGSLYRMQFGRRRVVVVSDPDLVNDALRNRPEGYRRLGVIERVQKEMGIGGVFSAEGDLWRKQRALVNQALHPKNIRQFYNSLIVITEKLKNRLDRYSEEDVIAIQDDLMRYTVDITTNLVFGYDVNTLESKGDIIQHHLEKVFPMITRRVNAPFPYWHFIRLPDDRALEKALSEIKKAVAGFVEHGRAGIARNPVLMERPTNLLEAMLVAQDQSEARFTDEEITGNVLTMLLAGEDTTANTLAWMLYFMTEYPEIQQRMQSETDQVLSRDKLLYSHADQVRLTYIEAVAYETMRLKSVAPLLFLETNHDLQLGPMNLPAGTPLFLLLRQCSLHESSFVDANCFNPERWLNLNESADFSHNPTAFLPFGAGSRFCPGRGLAMLEIKSAMAMLCRNFEFTRPTGNTLVEEEFAFVMAPKNLELKISGRQTNAS